MRNRWLPASLLLALLAGCAAPAAVPGTPQPSGPEASPIRTPPPTATPDSPPGPQARAYEPQTDSQGAVVFEITPLDLSANSETLEFEVVMNTHSVDLSWDLAAQAVLRTDTGREVSGLSWPVGGGHHYTAILTFPGRTSDGGALLDGANSITMTLRATDVAERVFTWEVRE